MSLGFPRYPEGMIENSPMLQHWVRVELDASPEGTTEHWLRVISRSFGTCPVRTITPTLKRWAIVTISLREKGFALLWRPKILVALAEDGHSPGFGQHALQLRPQGGALGFHVIQSGTRRELKNSFGLIRLN